MPKKVILDVDTGTDDAVALMVAALSPDLQLVGVTTVVGNCPSPIPRQCMTPWPSVPSSILPSFLPNLFRWMWKRKGN
ncbi:MAG TPA: hypothetical protein DEP47_10890 [Chloroflexi bacterium]|nr:hypothetical protein [Chloroflexota bacterium]